MLPFFSHVFPLSQYCSPDSVNLWCRKALWRHNCAENPPSQSCKFSTRYNPGINPHFGRVKAFPSWPPKCPKWRICGSLRKSTHICLLFLKTEDLSCSYVSVLILSWKELLVNTEKRPAHLNKQLCKNNRITHRDCLWTVRLPGNQQYNPDGL